MALSICYWPNYTLTKEKLRRKPESGAQNQLLSLKNRSQGKVNTRDFGALICIALKLNLIVAIDIYMDNILFLLLIYYYYY